MAELSKFPCFMGNRGRATWWWRQILHQNWKHDSFAHAQWKLCDI